MNADTITAVDEKNIPTGDMRAVAGTAAFDFRQAHTGSAPTSMIPIPPSSGRAASITIMR